MIPKKEIKMHVYSIFALALILVSYFILGGGATADEQVGGETQSVNVSIPEAMESGLAEDRFDATKREENRMQEQERARRLQQNSFELFKKDSSDSPDVCLETVSAHSSGKTPAPVVHNYNKGGAEEGARDTEIGKDVIKKKVMKQKREQIERELGINLSDYGYDRYKDDEEVSVVPEERSGFYGLDQEEENLGGDIKAVIHGEHKNLTSGSMVKMRLLEEVDVDGVRVPANTFVYGKLGFKNGRASISVSNINYRKRILKFTGSIYDNDGFEGLYVPENVVSDTKDKVLSDVVGGVDIDISSKSKALKSTATSVTNTIKSAIQGSVREAKISISSNYIITIKRKRK